MCNISGNGGRGREAWLVVIKGKRSREQEQGSRTGEPLRLGSHGQSLFRFGDGGSAFDWLGWTWNNVRGILFYYGCKNGI